MLLFWLTPSISSIIRSAPAILYFIVCEIGSGASSGGSDVGIKGVSSFSDAGISFDSAAGSVGGFIGSGAGASGVGAATACFTSGGLADALISAMLYLADNRARMRATSLGSEALILGGEDETEAVRVTVALGLAAPGNGSNFFAISALIVTFLVFLVAAEPVFSLD